MFITGHEITREEPTVDFEALGIKPSDDDSQSYNVILKKVVINKEQIGLIAQNGITLPQFSKNNVYDVVVQGVEITFLPNDETFFKNFFSED